MFQKDLHSDVKHATYLSIGTFWKAKKDRKSIIQQFLDKATIKTVYLPHTFVQTTAFDYPHYFDPNSV